MDCYNKIYFKPDVINRQDVNTLVNELEKAISYERSFMSIGRSTGEIMHDILNLPSVTPQPNVGRWIMHIDDLFPAESTMECNKCHEHQPITIDDNYCPNCGAKMIELQKSEDKK